MLGVKCTVSKQAQFYGSLNGWEKIDFVIA